jgi:hypothetical protein
MLHLPRVVDHVPMSILERRDRKGRLDLGSIGPVVVLPRAHEPSPGCPLGCRPPHLCGACAEGIRVEAVSWLQGLADDHFGFDLLSVLGPGSPFPGVSVA